MSEQEQTAVAEAPKVKKAPPEVTKVTMEDGREVNFVGKRKLNKEYTANGAGVTAVFDFRNGSSRTIHVGLDDPLLLQFAGHGAVQKIGDETAGEESVDDMVVAVDAMLERLKAGDWTAPRKVGDGFAGASIVIRAIMEATGKDQTFVKGYLDKLLEQGKESGLTRQALYNSFKVPTAKTAPIIERLEREKLTANSKFDSNGALDAMMAG